MNPLNKLINIYFGRYLLGGFGGIIRFLWFKSIKKNDAVIGDFIYPKNGPNGEYDYNFFKSKLVGAVFLIILVLCLQI
jgi:hypothetical protein